MVYGIWSHIWYVKFACRVYQVEGHVVFKAKHPWGAEKGTREFALFVGF